MLKKLLTQSFIQRTISGIALVVIIAFMLITGGDILLAFLGAVSIIGVRELYRIWNVDKSPLGIIGYLGVAIYYIMLRVELTDYWLVLVICMLVAAMATYVITFPKYKADAVMSIIFGFLYVGVMLSSIYRIRQLNDGIYLVWMVFLCSWISDTCAYLVGVTLGKHKFVPKLSPKKTVEGVIGGIAGSVLLGAVYGLILKEHTMAFTNPVLVCMLIGGIGSVVSMIGDLAASAIKRNYDIKDYGRLIPGHGGILDRFDSVIFVAPIIYYLCNFIM